MRFVLGTACALACGAALVAAQPAAAYDWSTPADLSLPGLNAARPQVAAGPDGTAFAIWVRDDGTNDRVEVARFTGSAWSEAVILSGAGAAEYPQIAVDADGRAIAVWRRKVDSTNWRIEAKTFDGTTWGAVESLSGDSTTATTPAIAMNTAGTAVVVWALGGGIKERRYTPLGGWSATTTALSSSGTNAEPDVAIDADGDATVVWHSNGRTGGDAQFEVLARRYAGGSWAADIAVLDVDGSRAFDKQPRVATNAAGKAVAAWPHYSAANNRDALRAAMHDGTAWLATGGQRSVQLVDPAANAAVEPQVVVDPAGYGTIIWDNAPASGNPGVSARTPFVSLTSTGPTTSVAAAFGMVSSKPQLALGSDQLPRAVWENASGPKKVIQTRRYGGAWEPATATLSDGTEDAAYPQIAIGPDGVTTVVWERFDGTNWIIQATRWPVPDAPTAVTATSLAGGRASVAFSRDSMAGLPDGTAGATGNTATCTSSDGGATRSASGATSPIVVEDLSVMKTYTCTVTTTSPASTSPASVATGAFLSGYILAVTSLTGSGTVTDDTGQMNCTVACAATQVDGSTVVLTATPAAGWSFGGWAGSCEGSPGTTCSLSMSQGRDVRVTFTQNADPPGPNPGAVTAPSAPGGVTAAAGLRSAVVSWAAPASDGGSAITSYTATATPGGATCTSTSTSCTISGLLHTQAYTVTVTATNAVGTGSASAASAAVRPYAKLKMKKPRGSGGRLTSRVRVTGAATITQTAATKAGKRACRKTVRAKRKGSVAVSCTLGRATRSALKKRAQTLTVTTTVLTKKGATLQATHTVRVKKTR